MDYITSTRVQRALILRREIDTAYDRGIGSVPQWVVAFSALGYQLRDLNQDELDQYRTVTEA